MKVQRGIVLYTKLDVSTDSFQDKLVSADDTLYCPEVFATFSHGYLPSYCVQRPHEFPIHLKDYDPYGSDDIIKIYEGMFEGGTMTHVAYISMNGWPADEPVDNKGDDIGEMYINATLKSLSQDEVNEANGRGESMFYYILYSN